MLKLFLVIIQFFYLPLCWGNSYTIEDLQALERTKSYEEFLNHALDIRPSQRDDQWQEMVSHMATSFITEKSSKNQYTLKSFQFIEDLFNWPNLREDKLFGQLRTDFGLSFLSQCFEKHIKNKLECTKLAQTFWHNSLDKIRVGSGIGLLYSKYEINEYDLWEYYKYAINSDFSQYYCSRKDVQEIVINRLSLEISFEYDTKPTLNKLEKLINKACLNSLAPLLKDSLKSKNIVLSTLSFQLLRAMERLETAENDLFLTSYILNQYTPGTLYNLAWNNLHQMSLDYSRRMITVKALKDLDPLPGRVFALKDMSKREIIGKYLSQKIPEYFDYYAQTCISYYEGSRSFPYGIPTANCDDFFQLVKNYSMRTQELHLKYSGLKK